MSQLKKDLESCFNRIRVLKTNLKEKFPEAFATTTDAINELQERYELEDQLKFNKGELKTDMHRSEGEFHRREIDSCTGLYGSETDFQGNGACSTSDTKPYKECKQTTLKDRAENGTEAKIKESDATCSHSNEYTFDLQTSIQLTAAAYMENLKKISTSNIDEHENKDNYYSGSDRNVENDTKSSSMNLNIIEPTNENPSLLNVLSNENIFSDTSTNGSNSTLDREIFENCAANEKEESKFTASFSTNESNSSFDQQIFENYVTNRNEESPPNVANRNEESNNPMSDENDFINMHGNNIQDDTINMNISENKLMNKNENENKAIIDNNMSEKKGVSENEDTSDSELIVNISLTSSPDIDE